MGWLLNILPPRPGSYFIRYALTTVLVAVCIGVVALLRGQTGLYAFFIFYLAIFLASVLFDHNSGFYATGLSVAFMYFYLKPSDALLPDEYTLTFAMFVLISLGVSLVSEGLRKEWERAVAAERMKDLLLQELRHRTKNDMAMALSVLALQARTSRSDDAKSALDNAAARIRAIAGAHDQFGPLNDEGRIGIKDYVTRLCDHFTESLRDVRPISIQVDVDDAFLKANDAIPIGLIINELVTNAIKHAFPDNRAGIVRVTLKQGQPRVLTVEDDGVGCPPTSHGGIGRRLTHLLAQQLGGRIEWEALASGCRVRVVLAN